ncbi:MAG: hypothetical protein WBD47_08910 [Phormidesmis sp.]
MKPIAYLASDLPNPTREASQTALPLSVPTPPNPDHPQKETLRHILLGSPGAIRQTIYLLHSLHYAESGLWSPIMSVGQQMLITPAQGEAMSLLRRSL